jgi:hypothetical protein
MYVDLDHRESLRVCQVRISLYALAPSLVRSGEDLESPLPTKEGPGRSHQADTSPKL